MPFGIDILEDEIKSWGHEILEILLLDHTTGKNIIWATDDYQIRGEGYGFHDHITIEKITGDHTKIELEPLNKEYPIIKLDEDSEYRILGVLKCVL